LKDAAITTHVTISIPVELIERARVAGINISQACRAGLEARLAGETVIPSELVSRVEQLEQHVRELAAWRRRVVE
jgi:D-aminopeptidase